MGISERRQVKENFSQRLARAKEIERQQIELREKMDAIKTFPGSLDEFSQLTGERYDFVKLPGKRQFLEGGRLNWALVDGENRYPFKNRDLFNPLNWRKTNVGIYGSYSGVLAKAVELGADALIHYGQTNHEGLFREMGVPVKKINPSPNPQSH